MGQENQACAPAALWPAHTALGSAFGTGEPDESPSASLLPGGIGQRPSPDTLKERVAGKIQTFNLVMQMDNNKNLHGPRATTFVPVRETWKIALMKATVVCLRV